MTRILTILAVLTLSASSALADARVVSGRTRPSEPTSVAGAESRFRFSIGGGMLSGGDLFRVVVPETRTWTSPAGVTFNARRITATLDEDVLFQAGFAMRVGAASYLRLEAASAKMNIAALANDSQVVSPFLWDAATFTRLDLAWEQALAVGVWRPYLVAGISWLDMGTTAPAMDQSHFAPSAGAGLEYAMGGRMSVRAEVLDTVLQLGSEGLSGDVVPQDAEFTERGPQHLVGLTVILDVAF